MSNIAFLFNNCVGDIRDEKESLESEASRLKRLIRTRKSENSDEYTNNSSYTSPNILPAPCAFESSEYSDLWDSYNAKWSEFDREQSHPITYSSIPFPPCDSDVLEFTLRQSRGQTSREAFHAACRRYHPDKFIQRYGTDIAPDEVSKITDRLTSIMQSLNSQWQLRNTR